MNRLICSFVYGLDKEQEKKYNSQIKNRKDNQFICMPMLVKLEPDKHSKEKHKYNFINLPYFTTYEDFILLSEKNGLVGNIPKAFSPIPNRRFGTTGLCRKDKHIYCGSWNGIYMLDVKNLDMCSFISNYMTHDIHSLCFDSTGKYLITMLPSEDCIVYIDSTGKVVGGFIVNGDLSISSAKHLFDIDWRLVDKDRRGSCGRWHFNYIQAIDNKLWITSRCINGFIVVDLVTGKVIIQTLRLGETALIHDGILVDDKFYFTSIDGKIIVADYNNKIGRDGLDTIIYQLAVCDDNGKFIRLPNWGRGIAVKDGWMYTTIDGRYGSEPNFKIYRVKRKDENDEDMQLMYNYLAIIGNDVYKLDYITGFDLLVE